MKMEESPPSEKSKQEKNSPTATNSKKKTKTTDSKEQLKVLNFISKDNLQNEQEKFDLLDLLTLAAVEVESGRDYDVNRANCGIVILANADGDSIESSSITIYTTQSSPIKLIGIMEFVKNQIIEQS
jgi:hypothetical protein